MIFMPSPEEYLPNRAMGTARIAFSHFWAVQNWYRAWH